MIPTYSSENTHKMGIVMHHLGQLNEYDFTKPHRHDYFEFFYFKKGGGNHIIDFKIFPITDNSVHIVAPGQIHQVNRELDSEGNRRLFVRTYLFRRRGIETNIQVKASRYRQQRKEVTRGALSNSNQE